MNRLKGNRLSDSEEIHPSRDSAAAIIHRDVFTLGGWYYIFIFFYMYVSTAVASPILIYHITILDDGDSIKERFNES